MAQINKPIVSIILPGIRPNNWDKLYDSILNACQRYSFELIICSPFPLTEKLQALPNVKYVKDLGSPVRASNIAGLLAEGELLTWIADDGTMLEDSLDKNIELLQSMGNNYKNCLVIKYLEGKNGTEKKVMPDSTYFIRNTDLNSPYFPQDWLTFNNPLLYRKFYDELGGLDCSYETTPVAHLDFSVRIQSCGAIVKISQVIDLDCNHMPEQTGDHSSIHIGQLHIDAPKYRKIYHNIEEIKKVKVNLPVDDWKNSPFIWKRRFKSGVPKNYEEILELNKTPDYSVY